MTRGGLMSEVFVVVLVQLVGGASTSLFVAAACCADSRPRAAPPAGAEVTDLRERGGCSCPAPPEAIEQQLEDEAPPALWVLVKGMERKC